LPQILRTSARLDAEVTIHGMRTYLEVHNREAFETNLAENQMTADDRKAMAEILRRKN
jgi:DNA-binding transcriptional regulator/RsmH inhibitor MraZ